MATVIITKERFDALIQQLKSQNKISDPTEVKTRETIILKKFEGEIPKLCREEDCVETVVAEFVDGVLVSHEVIPMNEDKKEN